MRHFVLASAFAPVLAACAHSSSSPETPAYHHRFEHAEHWASQFDDPTRDSWQAPERVVAAMRLAPGMVVADVGAGTGYFEGHLSRAVGQSGKVLALDVEPEMVRHLQHRAASEQLANVEARQVAPDSPGLESASVDRVLIVDTWHHMDGRPAYAARLAAALKPGGEVVIVDFRREAHQGPPPEHRVEPAEVVRVLTEAGLSARVVEVGLTEQYVVIGAAR